MALYDFLTGEKKWVHKGVEGTLFLIRRRVVPIYRYIVLNKKSQGDPLGGVSATTAPLNLIALLLKGVSVCKECHLLLQAIVCMSH